jgi:hypothetical protein
VLHISNGTVKHSLRQFVYRFVVVGDGQRRRHHASVADEIPIVNVPAIRK